MRDNTKYNRPADDVLAKTLSPAQYEIMVNGGTEAPYTSEHLQNDKTGIYVDAATGEPLFTTYDQYDAGCGWPSFTRPMDAGSVTEREDLSHGMVRTEVLSGGGRLHLGHVFPDGPKERGGLRYCVNGAAIRFVPLEDMEAEGYSFMMPYMNKREAEERAKK